MLHIFVPAVLLTVTLCWLLFQCEKIEDDSTGRFSEDFDVYTSGLLDDSGGVTIKCKKCKYKRTTYLNDEYDLMQSHSAGAHGNHLAHARSRSRASASARGRQKTDL